MNERISKLSVIIPVSLMALCLSGVDPEKLVRFYYRPLKGKRRRG